MSDLVQRLRTRNGRADGFGLGPVCDEAADALEAKDAEIERLRAALATAQQGRRAKEQYDEFDAQEESEPLERLRFFCSLAMVGQDWLDVEPFFDAVRAAAQAETVRAVEVEREAIIMMMPGGYSVDPQWVCDAIRARGAAQEGK